MTPIARVMVLQARDRVTWFVIPASILAAGFGISLGIALSIVALTGSNTEGTYTAAVAAFFFVMVVEGINTVIGTFPFAVGFGTRRRDYVIGTVAMAAATSAVWAILLGLLSLSETHVIENWGVGLHFFHLPVFSDGSFLRQICWSQNSQCAISDPSYFNNSSPFGQFWVYFVLMLFLYLLGLVLGSIYVRFGRTGEYILAGAVFLLLSILLLLSSHLNWWGAMFGWLGQQTAAGLVSWLVPVIVICALASYVLLRKATV